MPSAQWEQRINNWGEKHGHSGESYESKKAAYYEHRVTTGAEKHGLDPSSSEGRRAGRGHGSTPEHGYSERVVGQSIIITMSGREPLSKMERALDRADRLNYGSRGALILTKSDGTRMRLFAGATTSGRKGYSLAGMAQAAATGNFAGAIAGGKYEDDIADAVEIQLEIF